MSTRTTVWLQACTIQAMSEAGKYAATALAAFLFASPEFQPDFVEAKQELREALKLPALP